MSEPAATEYEWTTIKPAMDSLEFGIHVPKGWNKAPIPQEQPDFSDPSAFMPLALFVAPFGAVVFSVAVRPVFEQGGPKQWLIALAQQQQGMQFEPPQDCELNELKGATCLATLQSDVGPMQSRSVILVNGNTMVLLSALAPVQVWPSLVPTFDNMFGGFQMRWKLKGKEEPAPASATPTAEDEKPTLPADIALAGDGASLDPEHKMNVYFRDHGIGLVPRVLEVNESERYALIGCGAIVAIVQVPLGWHAIDDGKRTLVFDPENKIQVNLNVLQPGPLNIEQVIEAILGQVQQANPGVEHVRMTIAGMPTLGLRNLKADGEEVEQAFMFRPHAVGGDSTNTLLQVRVTATPGEMIRAMNLAEVLVRGMRTGA